MCDRIRHCSDGSDERGCSCKLSNLITLCWYADCMCAMHPCSYAASYPGSFQLIIAMIVTTADTTTSRPSSGGSNLGIIIGSILGMISFLLFVCGMMIIFVRNCMRSQSHSSNVPPRVQQPSITYSYSLDQPPTVNSSSEPTSTPTGLPHSTVPLESELQNTPPPAYSTAHQYPAFTQPDEATSQNKTVNEEPIKEPPPPYPD